MNTLNTDTELPDVKPPFGYDGIDSVDAHNTKIKEAQEAGFTVMVAQADEILLDLDTPESELQFEGNLQLLASLFGVTNVERWKSKSKGHHVIVHIATKGLSDAERIALQAALGSDGKREIIAIKRLRDGDTRPSVLFKPTVKKGGKPTGKKK